MRFNRSTFLSFAAVLLISTANLGLSGCKPSDKSATTDGTATGGKGEAADNTGTNTVPQDTSGDTIKIGEYASMTGATATFGVQSDSGVQYALQEINGKGGIGGKKVEVELQDDRSLPDEAKTVATQFSADPKIVAVVGEVASSRSKAAAQVYQRAGIPMVSPSSTNPDVTKIGDYIFRVCFIDPFQGYVMAKFAYDDLHARNIAIFRNQSEDYSVGLADSFKDAFQKLGGTSPIDKSYSNDDSDYRPQLSQFKGSDAIFIPGYYGEVGTIARQARELGIKIPLLGGDGWDSDQLVAGAGGPGKALEGSYFSTHYSKDDKTPRVQDFVKKYAASHGGVAPAALVAQGYDAMMILADAIKRANSTDRAKVRDALAQTKNYPGITGDITIDPQRDAVKSAVVLEIKGNDFVYKKTVQPLGTGQ